MGRAAVIGKCSAETGGRVITEVDYRNVNTSSYKLDFQDPMNLIKVFDKNGACILAVRPALMNWEIKISDLLYGDIDAFLRASVNFPPEKNKMFFLSRSSGGYSRDGDTIQCLQEVEE